MLKELRGISVQQWSGWRIAQIYESRRRVTRCERNHGAEMEFFDVTKKTDTDPTC